MRIFRFTYARYFNSTFVQQVLKRGLSISILISLRPSVRQSVRQFRVSYVTPTVLCGFFLNQAQMITSMSGCVVHNDLWPWHISPRSFSHDFAVKLLKYITSCRVRCSRFLDELFPSLAQMITSIIAYVACNELWIWFIYIIKVMQPWLCNTTARAWHILSHPLYSTYSSGLIISIFGTNYH